MSDYTAVAPPSNLSGGFDQSSAFADALQRARQIAAKINTPAGESAPIGGGTKRSLEDAGMERADHRETKKIAALNDPFGAQLAAMQHQSNGNRSYDDCEHDSIQVKMDFQKFEARKMGIGAASNAIITEEFRVPDKMVGLIIGRGGEQITRLQSDSDCKIQMAAESGGLPDRPCTLTGTKQSIEKAKDLIMQIVNRGGSSSGPMDGGSVTEGHATVEMMIPGGKVGLVIGKGGETIKSLQERAGVKMVMIQDGPQQTMHEKPLRITGEPQKCEYARQLVMDLITEKELENVPLFQSMNRGGFHRNQMGTNEYGTSQTSTQEVTVPRQAVGVVIGKGGDMIKKIQQDSGARVQFHQDDTPGDRICMLTGSPEQIQKAQGIIHDLINSIMARDQQSMGRGRGRGRGFDDRRPPFGPGGPGPGPGMGRGGPPGGNRGGPGDKPEIQYSVPANKCGIVIGKGGETIRTINQQSGAHVELSRQPPPNPNEKIFIIRGTQQQIEHAKQLINEKIGGPPGAYPGPGGPPGSYAQPNQQPPPPPQAYAPQGWGNAYQHWQNQSGTPNDPSQSQQPQQGPQPDYSAAWVEYYRSLGMYREAEMIEQQARANQQAQAQQQPQAPGVAQTQGQSQPQQQQYGQQGQQYNQTQQPSQNQPQAQQQFPQYGQYGSTAPGTGPAAGGQYSAQHPAYNYGYGNYPQQQYPAPTQ